MYKFITIHEYPLKTVNINLENVSEIVTTRKRNKEGEWVDRIIVYMMDKDSDGQRLHYEADTIHACNEIEGVSLRADCQVVPVADGHIYHYFANAYDSIEEIDGVRSVCEGYYGYQTAPMIGWLIDPQNIHKPFPVSTPRVKLFEAEDHKTLIESWFVEYPDGRIVSETGEEIESIAEWVAKAIESRQLNVGYENIGDELPTVKPTAVNVRKARPTAPTPSATKPSQGKPDDLFKLR